MNKYRAERQALAVKNGESFREIWILCPHCGAIQNLNPDIREISDLSWQQVKCSACNKTFSYQYERVYSTSKKI
jgi:transposase-like protein